MILKRLTTHRLQTLLVLICTLSTTLTTLGAEPTTRPATPKAEAGSDPASKLRAALPTGWSIQGSSPVGRTRLHPGRQWSHVPTGYLKLLSTLIHTEEGLQRATPPVIVWLAHRQAEKAKWQATANQQGIEQKPTEYLGLGSGYHVYVHISPGAAKLWSTAKRDIGKAMGIKTPTIKPAQPTATSKPAYMGEAGSVVLITQNGDTVSYTVDGVDCGDITALKKALGSIPKDSHLSVQIETNVPAGRVAEVLAVARKLRLMKISITVVRTSSPPVKPERRLPL